MMLVVPGLNGYSPLKEALSRKPHHVADIIVKQPAVGYSINKMLVSSSASQFPFSIIIGKSYGAWVAAESNAPQPMVFLGLPLRDGAKVHPFPRCATKPALIYGSDDPYITKELISLHRDKFSAVQKMMGDHSLRPITAKKIKALKKYLEVYHEEKKPEQSVGSTLHSVDPFLQLKKRAVVPVARTTRYARISDTEFSSVPARLRDCVNGRYGPITVIVKRKSPLRQLHIYQTSILDTSSLNPWIRSCAATGGLGTGSSAKEALRKAVYESLERYSLTLSMFDTVELPYNDIPTQFRVPLRELQFIKTTLPATLRWTVIRKWSTGEEKLYPVQLITPNIMREQLRETTSTGTALGTTLEQAVESGLQEAIERHTLVSWFYGYNNVKARKITVEGRLARQMRDFQLHAYLLEFQRINTVFIIAAKNGRFGIGSACGSYPSIVEKALQECMVTYEFAATLSHLTPKTPDEIVSLPQHFLYYQDKLPKLLAHLDSRRGGARVRVKPQMATTIRRLERSGYAIYYKDVTAPEVRGADCVVVKVIVFGFLDVIKKHRLAWKEYHPLKGRTIPALPLPFA